MRPRRRVNGQFGQVQVERSLGRKTPGVRIREESSIRDASFVDARGQEFAESLAINQFGGRRAKGGRAEGDIFGKEFGWTAVDKEVAVQRCAQPSVVGGISRPERTRIEMRTFERRNIPVL